jgi:prepilin-type N-terminal cleavage/methylation domain-containing protein
VRHGGFTLVEVAVVLVIVGLLLSGFVKGQELIVQSKVKRAVADFSGVAAAYHTYQDRYRQLPGDDRTADQRWSGATSGNGDGTLSGAYDTSVAGAESRLWWDHLRRAGLLTGSGTRQPQNAQTGMIGVQHGDGIGSLALGGLKLMICSASLPDKVAIGVDRQLDDGAGALGNVRAAAQPTAQPPTIDAATVPVAYVETGSNVYTLCRGLL